MWVFEKREWTFVYSTSCTVINMKIFRLPLVFIVATIIFQFSFIPCMCSHVDVGWGIEYSQRSRFFIIYSWFIVPSARRSFSPSNFLFPFLSLCRWEGEGRFPIQNPGLMGVRKISVVKNCADPTIPLQNILPCRFIFGYRLGIHISYVDLCLRTRDLEPNGHADEINIQSN